MVGGGAGRKMNHFWTFWSEHKGRHCQVSRGVSELKAAKIWVRDQGLEISSIYGMSKLNLLGDLNRVKVFLADFP